MRYHGDASGPCIGEDGERARAHLEKHLKRKVSASWSVATTLELPTLRFEAGVERSLPRRNRIKSGIAMRSRPGSSWKGEQGFDLRKNESSSGLKAATWRRDLSLFPGDPILFNFASNVVLLSYIVGGTGQS